MDNRIRANCMLGTPYPQICVEGKNIGYARLLSIPYAGMGGELAAILSYTYGHIVTTESDARLSELLICIAENEMRHFEILGRLIFMLGGDPRFCSADSRGCFSASELGYYERPDKILRASVLAEQNAIIMYRDISDKINDRCIKEILARIILDEEHHLKLFSDMQYMPNVRKTGGNTKV